VIVWGGWHSHSWSAGVTRALRIRHRTNLGPAIYSNNKHYNRHTHCTKVTAVRRRRLLAELKVRLIRTGAGWS